LGPSADAAEPGQSQTALSQYVQTLWETCGADGDAIVAEAARGRFLGAMQAGKSLSVLKSREMT